jgi:cytochrome c peroxidase
MRSPRERSPHFAATMTGQNLLQNWSRLALALAASLVASACAYNYSGSHRGVPFAADRFVALPAMSIPSDNPMTPEKVALGHDLFHDTKLSGDGTRSCATCHQPDRALAYGAVRSIGLSGRRLSRNTPGLMNVGFAGSLFVDGRARSLEEQALAQVTNPDEMGRGPDNAVDLIRADPIYRARFKEVFGAPVTDKTVAQALAAY